MGSKRHPPKVRLSPTGLLHGELSLSKLLWLAPGQHTKHAPTSIARLTLASMVSARHTLVWITRGNSALDLPQHCAADVHSRAFLLGPPKATW